MKILINPETIDECNFTSCSNCLNFKSGTHPIDCKSRKMLVELDVDIIKKSMLNFKNSKDRVKALKCGIPLKIIEKVYIDQQGIEIIKL